MLEERILLWRLLQSPWTGEELKTSTITVVSIPKPVNAVTGFKPPFTRATSTKAIFRANDYSNQALNKTFAAAFSKKTDNDYICTRENVEKIRKKKCFNWIHFWGAFKLSRDFPGLSVPPSPELVNNPWEIAVRIHKGLDFVWCKMSYTCFHYFLKDLALWVNVWLGLKTVAIRTLL